MAKAAIGKSVDVREELEGGLLLPCKSPCMSVSALAPESGGGLELVPDFVDALFDISVTPRETATMAMTKITPIMIFFLAFTIYQAQVT